MEKAILKTLIYANIFEYPLKGYEVLKWLIKKEATLIKVEKALGRLSKKLKALPARLAAKRAGRQVKSKNSYYFLPGRENLVATRKRREKQSKKYLTKAKIFSQFLKIIPWIKLVGISGGLAVDNCSRKDDIDLFIITEKNRLWISRFLAIGIFDLLAVRRKVGMKPKQAAGKFCLNTILDEDHLEQEFKDLYTAHEVLQMKLLWQREGLYTKYLSDNNWAFKFLPNWIGSQNVQGKMYNVKLKKNNSMFNFIEKLAKEFQLKIMKKTQGMERIEEGGLYFHPSDVRAKILTAFDSDRG